MSVNSIVTSDTGKIIPSTCISFFFFNEGKEDERVLTFYLRLSLSPSWGLRFSYSCVSPAKQMDNVVIYERHLVFEELN